MKIQKNLPDEILAERNGPLAPFADFFALFAVKSFMYRLLTTVRNFRRAGGTGRLLQLRVLRLGFFQDGKIRVGILPQRKEILIGGFRLRRVSSDHIRPAQSQFCK